MSLAIIVFLAAFAADVAWASWSLNGNKGNPIAAATWGVVIVLLGAISVRAYVDNAVYLVPCASGAWLGTYVTVRRG